MPSIHCALIAIAHSMPCTWPPGSHTHRRVSCVSWPMEAGIVPLSLLLCRFLQQMHDWSAPAPWSILALLQHPYTTQCKQHAPSCHYCKTHKPALKPFQPSCAMPTTALLYCHHLNATSPWLGAAHAIHMPCATGPHLTCHALVRASGPSSSAGRHAETTSPGWT